MSRFRKGLLESGTFVGLQALESRNLMSVAVNLSQDGFLEISGDQAPDTVQVQVQQTYGGVQAKIVANGTSFTLPPNAVRHMSIRTGAGNDKVEVTTFGDVAPLSIHVDAGAGNDKIKGVALGVSYTNDWNDMVNLGLTGGDGNDVIELATDNGQVSASGGAGNDKITILNLGLFYGRTQFVYGDDGDDTITNLGETSVWMYGGAGNDLLLGGVASETFDGGSGRNLIKGGAGNDQFNFNENGNDTIFGEAGYDTLYVRSAKGSVNFDGGDDWDSVGFEPGAFLFHQNNKGSRFLADSIWQFNADGGGKG